MAIAAVALVAAPGLAQAQEGSGCDGFTKWPLDRERAALVRTDKASLPNGGALPYDAATTLELKPFSLGGVAEGVERGTEVAFRIRRSFRPRRAGKAWRVQDHNLV